MSKKSLIFLISIFTGIINISAEPLVRIVHQNGFGARSFALANNYVALSTDLSAVHWNPAGLSFSLAREFNISFDGIQLNGESSFFGTNVTDNLKRLKLASGGLMVALPSIQGGLTFAGTVHNSTTFDDLSVFKGDYTDVNNSYFSVDNSARNTGGLTYWSGAFGLQVAKNTGIGVAVSLISGKENVDEALNIIRDNSKYNYDYYDLINKIEGKYVGYDIKMGLLYKGDLVSAGARFSLPQRIRLTEQRIETGNEPAKDSSGWYLYKYKINETYKGRLYSSFAGAAGFSLTLPFVIVSTEGRVTLPFDYRFPSKDIPSGSQAAYYKFGGGVGLEVPLVKMPVLLRAGYSFDELDLHQYLIVYDGGDSLFNDDVWSDDGIRVDKNKHQFTAGIGFFSSAVSFDISYGYSTWRLVKKESLTQDYNSHRIIASFALRY
jgi:hypothetical protein